MIATPPVPTGKVRWVYDDPSGVPEEPVLIVPAVPFTRKAA
jgi:hypothetical protein